jgi:predicted dithiol-disulfide oxidoreductase (DUF899 family)
MKAEPAIVHPKIVSREEWLSARKEHLSLEKELTKQSDKVHAERRRLPMVKLERAYEFDGPSGKVGLKDLFDGQRQLIIYHFMFDPAWVEGCPGCTGFVDALGDLSMLAKRDTAFAVISRAPLEKLNEYKESKSWDIRWYSSYGSDFNYDYHVTLDEKKAPVEYNFKSKAELEAQNGGHTPAGAPHGLSVLLRMGDDIFHTYSAYARGTENLTNSYALLDTTPYGRQEDFEDSPAGWPQKPTYGKRD